MLRTWDFEVPHICNRLHRETAGDRQTAEWWDGKYLKFALSEKKKKRPPQKASWTVPVELGEKQKQGKVALENNLRPHNTLFAFRCQYLILISSHMSRKDMDVRTHRERDGEREGKNTLRVSAANYISCKKTAHPKLKSPPEMSATCHQHQLATVIRVWKCIALMMINAIITS